MTAVPVLRLDRVAAGHGKTPLWSDLTFDIAPGEFIAVLGGNGTGKTTLLRILLGQLDPAAGRVEVLGSPPRRGNSKVGYVPQQHTFDRDLPLRGVDLVRLGLDGHRWGIALPSRAAKQRVTTAITAVGADSYATEPVGRLSGGEQQRLRVAQALVADPLMLLADEPLLSLDLASQQQVCALLDARRRQAGTAVVVVTHEVNPVLPYADRVLYLAGGAWAAGAPDDVLTTETLSRLYQAPVDVLRVRDRIVIVGTPDASHHPHHELRV
ncbi:MAG: zinc/manganese transport system ATP-binding protein [Frankiaceae bacterium]|nr:zinc/manganese transport system ATP-binding protein [Frankiaceae bacterium]